MGYWLINTAGIGSIIVVVVGLSVLLAYINMLRWIQTAPSDPVFAETDQPNADLATVEAGGEHA